MARGDSSGVEMSVSGVVLNDIPRFRLAWACSIVGAALTSFITPDWVSELIVGSILSRLVSLSVSPPIVMSVAPWVKFTSKMKVLD